MHMCVHMYVQRSVDMCVTAREWTRGVGKVHPTHSLNRECGRAKKVKTKKTTDRVVAMFVLPQFVRHINTNLLSQQHYVMAASLGSLSLSGFAAVQSPASFGNVRSVSR